MKISEMRQLNLDELKVKESQLAEELFQIRFKHSLGQLKNTARLRLCRGDLAKIKTLIKEKISK